MIEVDSLAKLNVIRYDADGDGVMTGADAVIYAAAFPYLTYGLRCRYENPDAPPDSGQYHPETQSH